jgi:hypothetical protein
MNTRMSKIARHMNRGMQKMAQTSSSRKSSVDDSSSNNSHDLQRQESTQSLPKERDESTGVVNTETFDLEDNLLDAFEGSIPKMSNDGMSFDDLDKVQRTQSMNNELAEGEQEEMVIDSGNEYRMISIMRQRRPVLVKDPFSDTILEDTDENRLTTIEEAQTLRWSSVPKFGADEV